MSKINQIEQELPKGRGLYFFRKYNTKSEIASKISKDLKKWFNEEKAGISVFKIKIIIACNYDIKSNKTTMSTYDEP